MEYKLATYLSHHPVVLLCTVSDVPVSLTNTHKFSLTSHTTSHSH